MNYTKSRIKSPSCSIEMSKKSIASSNHFINSLSCNNLEMAFNTNGNQSIQSKAQQVSSSNYEFKDNLNLNENRSLDTIKRDFNIFFSKNTDPDPEKIWLKKQMSQLIKMVEDRDQNIERLK